MNKLHTQLYTLAIALIWITMATPVFAEESGLIDVDFHGNVPLFAEANLLPGDGITRQVTVKNESGNSQDVYLQLLDADQTKGFADVLELTVTDGSTTLLDGVVLSSLFGGTQRSLTPGLTGGDSITYDVTIAFAESAGNEYQEGEAGFDFCIGFSGGAFGCDGEGDNGEEPSNPPEEEFVGGGRVLNSSESSGGGSGGKGGSQENLIIENEGAENTDGETGSADVTWETNKPATSRVVCGPLENGPYTFDLDTDNFGYPWGTEESDAYVTEHLVPFIGLDDGVYLCRAASREDADEDWTVSSEFSFTLSDNEEGATGASFLTTGATPVAFAQTDDTENEPEENMTDESEDRPNNQVAGVFSSIEDSLANGTCNIAWWIWILVIVVFLIITTWTREMLTHLSAQEPIKRLYVFSIAGVVVFFIALFMNNTAWILPMGVGTLAIILATIVDALRTKAGDTGHIRLVRIIISLISVLLVTLLVALVMEWTCAIIPLVVSIIILAIRYALHKGAE